VCACVSRLTTKNDASRILSSRAQNTRRQINKEQQALPHMSSACILASRLVLLQRRDKLVQPVLHLHKRWSNASAVVPTLLHQCCIGRWTQWIYWWPYTCFDLALNLPTRGYVAEWLLATHDFPHNDTKATKMIKIRKYPEF
jgi:hypothetical protein